MSPPGRSGHPIVEDRPMGSALGAGRDLAERIANAIGERIVGGAYPPEAVLPREIELSEEFAVSRSALREAFRLLAAKGLIVSRRKTGARVRPRAAWNMLDASVLSWHLRAAPTDAFVAGLFEMRKIVEPAASALAAERRTPDMVERIATALDEMVRYQDGSGDVIAADLRFHQAILDAAGNHFLASFGAVIGSSLVASFQLSWNAHVRTPDYALRQHREVLDAIREQRPEDAHAAMFQLLRSAIEDVHEALRQRQLRAGG